MNFIENFVKVCFPKNIKDCGEVLSDRNNLRKEVTQLQIIFRNLMLKQKNLHSKDELIFKNTCDIEKIQDKIQMVEEMCKDKDPSEQEKLLRQLNEDLKKN